MEQLTPDGAGEERPGLSEKNFLEAQAEGTFLVGVDFGKKVDYSVVALLDRQDNQLRLTHLHRFPRETAYASVIGYVRALSDRYHVIVQCL